MKSVLVTTSLLMATGLVNAQTPAPEQAPVTKQVKVQDKKKGENVYNFHFYHGDEKKKQEPKAPEAKEVIEEKKEPAPVVPIPPVLPPKKGNGVEGGLFSMSFLGDVDEVAKLDMGIGLRLGFLLQNQSGAYITPGFMIAGASAESDIGESGFMTRDYEGSAYGLGLKLGKMFDRSGTFGIDVGIDLHYLSGDLDVDGSIFGSGSYEFKSAGAAIYAGPTFQMDNFTITGLVSLGAASLSVDESFTENSSINPDSGSYSNSKTLPFIGLNVNATYLF